MQVRDEDGMDFFFGLANDRQVLSAVDRMGENFNWHDSCDLERFYRHIASHITPFNNSGVLCGANGCDTIAILCFKLVEYEGYIKCYINSLAVDRRYKGSLPVAQFLIRKLICHLHAEFGIEKICNVTIVVEDEGQAPVGFYKAAGFKKTSAIYEADALELNWRALLGRDGGHWEELSGELNELCKEAKL